MGTFNPIFLCWSQFFIPSCFYTLKCTLIKKLQQVASMKWQFYYCDIFIYSHFNVLYVQMAIVYYKNRPLSYTMFQENISNLFVSSHSVKQHTKYLDKQWYRGHPRISYAFSIEHMKGGSFLPQTLPPKSTVVLSPPGPLVTLEDSEFFSLTTFILC